MTNRELFERAKKLMPGGVSSPVRAFKAVGGEPIVVSKGEGSRIWDVEGKEYIDFLMSWGPLILGHSHPRVVQALEEQAKKGLSYGITNPHEITLAELVVSAMPSVEMVRFVSSGTEATMSAIRLARGYTGRKYIVKFEGCYHGTLRWASGKCGLWSCHLGNSGHTGGARRDRKPYHSFTLQRCRCPKGSF
jgi:glutamate-1-semialdehyde 2,1-aminomutase